jgi:dinuclear metal center YbgI/SA1388 family protein
MGIVLKELISFMEKTVPRYLSEKWDNAGFLIGDAEKTVRRVLICLDVTSDVVEEAVSKKVDLIISHHPIIFNGLKSITTESPSGKNIIRLIENGVCVYSAHTNLDIAENGVNDTLAKRLGINVEGNIEDTYVEKLYKFVVFVPEDYWDTVRESICRAGAGRLGNYGDCTFSVDGTGTFMPLSGSNPFIGKAGELEKVKEKRLEAIVPEKSLNGVVKAMFSATRMKCPPMTYMSLKLTGTSSVLAESENFHPKWVLTNL